MKIAISSTGNTLEATMDPRFGRAAYFIIYETDTEKFEAIANAAVSATGGAGPSAAQTVADSGAKIVISGAFGPNASRALKGMGIRMFIGESCPIKDNVVSYLRGRLAEIDQATVAGKH